MQAAILAAGVGLFLGAGAPDDGPWTRFGGADGAALFGRLKDGSGPQQVLVRIDYRRPQGARPGAAPYRSVLVAHEVDCRTGLSRVISTTFFAEPGLRGATWTRAYPSIWSEARPALLQRGVLRLACRERPQPVLEGRLGRRRR